MSKEVNTQQLGLDICGNSLGFARHNLETINIEGKENKKNTTIDTNIIRNNSKEKKRERMVYLMAFNTKDTM